MEIFGIEIANSKRLEQRITTLLKAQADGMRNPSPANIGNGRKNSLTEQLATRARIEKYMTFGLSNILPNPDPILKAMGKDQEAYLDILNDGALYQNIGSRKAGTLRKTWDIIQGKSETKVFDYVALCFENLDITEISREQLEAIYYGYQISEVIYLFDGKYYMPSQIESKPNDWFAFSGEDNRLQILKSNGYDYEDVPPYKFLVAQNEATYDNPYGVPLLAKCYWNSIFRREGKKFLITFVEKFGMPWVHGTFNAEVLKQFYAAPDYVTAANQLKAYLEYAVQDCIIVNSQGIDISLMTPSGQTGNDIYDRLLENCKKENAETILGHSGSAISTAGKLGNDTSAMKVREEIIDMDSKLVEGVFNKLIKWICEINFGTKDIPYFQFNKEDSAQLDLASQTVQLSQAGVKYTKEYFIRKFNLAEDEFEMAVVQPLPVQGGVSRETIENALMKAHELHPEIPDSEIFEMINILYDED